MRKYQCNTCPHVYGARIPSAPTIALHLAVSHSGAAPIVAVTQ